MTLDLRDLQIPIKINADGVALVEGTRVPIDTIIYAFQMGATAEQIVDSYPSVKLADVYLVIAYYLRNRDEVEVYLKVREEFKEQVRRENLQRFPQEGLRERLLNRLIEREQG